MPDRLALLPLRERSSRKNPIRTIIAGNRRSNPAGSLGVLIVERFDNGMFDAPQRERIDAVARQSAIALDNAQSHENVPFMPLLQAIGASRMVCSSSAVAQDGCRAGCRRG